MDATIPSIEIPDDADALRVRRPNRKINSRDSADRAQLRAELLVKLMMISFGEEMQIHLAHDRAETIRIVQLMFSVVPRNDAHFIVAIAFFSRHDGLEKPFVIEALGREFLSVRNDIDLFGFGTKDANDQIITDAMRTKNAKRIGMRAGEKCVHF